eukprot:GHVU01070222.1.p1 GENE.GHVU01070222.1~~GHVU01070222.1.p1  ORF type:complete len:101 (+),score=17.89 GHVU01070222.1:43-303(+)
MSASEEEGSTTSQAALESHRRPRAKKTERITAKMSLWGPGLTGVLTAPVYSHLRSEAADARAMAVLGGELSDDEADCVLYGVSKKR